jgi:predicted dehydrogenase
MEENEEKLSIGVIGLGGRGLNLLEACILPRRNIRVDAVCDLYEDRRTAGAAAVAKAGQAEPVVCGDYRQVLDRRPDAVLISTGWVPHVEIACAAMRAGIYTACEVGASYSIEDCWRLVRAHEETGVHCMMLENCCYGRYELMVLNMVRQGLFGEVVHCRGAYRHDLRDEIAHGRENRHYRFENYLHRNCENYPTHELGPIARVLNINQGNRMLTLNSIASKAAGLKSYLRAEQGLGGKDADLSFAQGDVVTTIIKCAHGETIDLTLDTSLPRAYSRGFQVQGTRAMFCEENLSLFLDGEHNAYEFKSRKLWGNAETYRERYEHPTWRTYLEAGVKGGHDGMDWLEFDAFFEAVRTKAPAPIDVYDMASWMSVSALSEASIAQSGAPVSFPDFTNGRWMSRAPR